MKVYGKNGTETLTCDITFTADNPPALFSSALMVDNESVGTRIKATSETKFTYGNFWGDGSSSAKVTDSRSQLVLDGSGRAFWGDFTLRPIAAIGDNTLTMTVGGETQSCDIYFSTNDFLYAMAKSAKVDNVSIGTTIEADGGTLFTYASQWVANGSSVTVVSDGSQLVFSKYGVNQGTFALPVGAMAAGNHTLKITVAGDSTLTYTCSINLTLEYPYFYAKNFQLDNKSVNNTILLQSTDEMAYGLNWGSKQASYVVVTANGRGGYITEGIVDVPVYDGTDTGWFGTFTWDFSEEPPESLPRGPYTILHKTYDENNIAMDTLKCSVKLLPEPMSIAGLLSLLGLIGLARKNG